MSETSPVPAAPVPAGQAPSVPAVVTPAATLDPAAATPDPATPASSRSGWSGGRVLLVSVLVLVLGVSSGVVIGRQTADSGPSSLADAAAQTAKGDLPVGKLDTGALLGLLGQRATGGSGSAGLGNLGGLIGGLLDGNGKAGANGSGALSDLLGQLRDRLRQEFGNNGNGNGNAGSGGARGGNTPTVSR